MDADRDLEQIRFSDPFRLDISLKEALKAPEALKHETESASHWIKIRIYNWPEKVARGFGPPDAHPLPPRPRGDISLSIVIVVPPKQTAVTRQWVLKSYWPREATAPDADGYFQRYSDLFPRDSRDASEANVLPGFRRLWPTDTAMVVICHWNWMRHRRVCEQSQRTEDNRFIIGWWWYEDEFPKPHWKELDRRLHEVANYLLLSGPSGNVE